jgi:hypothetical protein
MNQTNGKSMIETQTPMKKAIDFIVGFLGSIILANIGIILIAQFNNSQLIWGSYFIWFWRLLIVGVAGFVFTKKRVWISVGIVAALLVQAFGM